MSWFISAIHLNDNNITITKEEGNEGEGEKNSKRGKLEFLSLPNLPHNRT